jgi:hypothetical protein
MREKQERRCQKFKHHESRINNFMKNTRPPTVNESEKPQWWQRFSRAFGLRRTPKLKVPGSAGLRFHHSELVIRNFPIAFGKPLQAGHK